MWWTQPLRFSQARYLNSDKTEHLGCMKKMSSEYHPYAKKKKKKEKKTSKKS